MLFGNLKRFEREIHFRFSNGNQNKSHFHLLSLYVNLESTYWLKMIDDIYLNTTAMSVERLSEFVEQVSKGTYDNRRFAKNCVKL